MSTSINNLPESQKQELLCTCAALALHDDGAEVTESNIQKMIAASGGKVEPYLPNLFARALKGVDIGSMLTGIGGGGGGGGAPVAAAAGGGAADASAAKPKEEEKKEESEESDADIGFSLFD